MAKKEGGVKKLSTPGTKHARYYTVENIQIGCLYLVVYSKDGQKAAHEPYMCLNKFIWPSHFTRNVFLLVVCLLPSPTWPPLCCCDTRHMSFLVHPVKQWELLHLVCLSKRQHLPQPWDGVSSLPSLRVSLLISAVFTIPCGIHCQSKSHPVGVLAAPWPERPVTFITFSPGPHMLLALLFFDSCFLLTTRQDSQQGRLLELSALSTL